MSDLARIAAAVVVMGGMALWGAGASFAAGSSSDSTSEPRPTLASAKQKIDREQWSSAITDLEEFVRDNPSSADAYNYLGYANRKMGRLDIAKGHYDKALAIDPNHRGAHEYLGELYVQKGDMMNARRQLAKLKELCPSGCEEFDMLAKVVETGKWN